MADVQIGASVSRDLLGKAPLQINDHVRYYAAPQFLGGQVGWAKQQAGSPWLNGMRTVSAVMENVTETLTIEVKAETAVEVQTAMAELVQAFQQDTYLLTVVEDGATYQYECDRAGYQIVWSGPRLVAKQGQVTFSVERQPVAVIGGV